MKDCVAIGYSDADWDGDLDNRQSSAGYVFQTEEEQQSVGEVRIQTVRIQTVKCRSVTTEAEFMSLSAAQEAVWMRQLLSHLGMKQTAATLLFAFTRIYCFTIMDSQNISTSSIALFVSKALRETLN